MTELELEVFRAGDYGEKGRWSEDDVARMAADYDPDVHEAPVTVDHAQSGPALGWVKGLRVAGPVLVATLHHLNTRLLGWLREGAFRKRSVELYPAFAATSGRPYLRAITFLGAAVPEVKGLRDPLFSDGETDDAVHIPFSPSPLSADLSGAAMAKSEASAKADPIHPISLSAEALAKADPIPASPDPVQAGRLFAENAELRGELGRLRRENAQGEILAACRALERDGRFLPQWYDAGIVSFMETLRGMEEAPEFSEAYNKDGAASFTPYAWFVRFLESLPPQVPLAEVALAESIAANDRRASAPDIPHAANVDPASIERHRRALALCSAEPALTYAEALLKSV